MSKTSIYNTWSQGKIDIFIAKHNVGSMGTLDENGYPHVLPMWHTFFEGMIHISFRIPKKKHSNLLANPKMSYTVEEGDSFDNYRGVLVQGDAEVVEDPELLERYYIAWAYRHFGSDDDPYCQRIKSAKRSVIRLRPVHVFTWDNRLLALL